MGSESKNRWYIFWIMFPDDYPGDYEGPHDSNYGLFYNTYLAVDGDDYPLPRWLHLI